MAIREGDNVCRLPAEPDGEDASQLTAGEIWRRLKEEDRFYHWGEQNPEELQILRENILFLRGLLQLS